MNSIPTPRSRRFTGVLTLVMPLAVALTASPAEDPGWKLPPETVRFKPGPGSGAAIATGNCLICHSADYITTQPPLDRAGWRASIQKMREKYGAPINTNSVDTLAEYLAKTYGRERPAR